MDEYMHPTQLLGELHDALKCETKINSFTGYNIISSDEILQFLDNNESANLLLLNLYEDSCDIIPKGIIRKQDNLYYFDDYSEDPTCPVVKKFDSDMANGCICAILPKDKSFLNINTIILEYTDGILSLSLADKTYRIYKCSNGMTYGEAMNMVKDGFIVCRGRDDKYIFNMKRNILNKDFDLIVQLTKKSKRITEYKPEQIDLYSEWRFVYDNEIADINRGFKSLYDAVYYLKKYGYENIDMEVDENV